MRSAALLILIGFFFLYSLKSKFAALYTYWWFAIFRPHEWAWNDVLLNLHLTKIAAVLLLGQAIFHRKIPRLDNAISFFIACFILLEWLANYMGGCSNSKIIQVITIVDLTIFIIVIFLTIETLEKKFTIAWLMTVVALSIGWHSGKGGIYALITGADNYGAENLTGFFSGSNAYALGSGILIFFMLFSLQFVSEGKTEKGDMPRFFVMGYKLLLPLIIFGTLYNIISLQSRGSFLATVIGLLLWMLLQEHSKRLLLIAFVALSLTLAVVPLPEGYTERISSAFAEKEELDKSAASRPHFWSVAIDISKDYPLGVGPGCYPAYYYQYDPSNGLYGRYRSVHSSHFQILAEIGYLGILVWAGLFFASYKKLWSIRKISKKQLSENSSARLYFNISNALICSMTVFLIGGSFYEYAYNDMIWLIWGIVVALGRIFSREQGREVKQS